MRLASETAGSHRAAAPPELLDELLALEEELLEVLELDELALEVELELELELALPEDWLPPQAASKNAAINRGVWRIMAGLLDWAIMVWPRECHRLFDNNRI